MEYMEREFARAKETPAYENTFKRLELNIRTRVVTKWLDMGRWDACCGNINAEALKGRSCFAGLDLGATSDLTSLCLLFPSDEGYEALWWYWVPRETAHRRQNRDRIDYFGWVNEGYIEFTDGNETDYRHIRKRINEIAGDYGVRELAADRLFQGAQLCQDLADDGFEVVPFGMGYYSMAAPTQELERLINRSRGG
jgi:phage terminase large subunit-like protein